MEVCSISADQNFNIAVTGSAGWFWERVDVELREKH